jgi:hypothetical protein
MLRFHTVRQSQAIDQIAIKEKGIPGILLMTKEQACLLLNPYNITSITHNPS